MPLAAGTLLGPYEILAPLGAGGMGEVYRARDKKLNRDVAIKVLPDLFATDLERLARFQREAQVLASLNHPNIAQIHGLEESGAVRGLVMELVEGEDLAQRLARGPIPPHDAFPVARQIAEALEAAHEQGIIHRDLKPANAKLRADGTVKVLDFGLAKALEPAGTASPDMTQSPTITTPAMTQAGLILGTAAYMSPEQARGRAADKRSDIWAFGCVLYEMLTGRRAFAGEDVADTLAAVLRADPDFSALPLETPAQISRLLRRCLQKDPRKRLPHIGVARLDLEEVQTEAGRAGSLPPAAERRRWRRPWLAAALATPLVIALGIAAWSSFRRPQAAVVMRFHISVPTMLNTTALTVSPNGRWIAFVAQPSTGRSALFVRPIDSVTPRQLEGTEGSPTVGQPGSGPIGRHFWSPDSRSIAFVAGGRLKRVDLAGGSAQTLCEVSSPGFLGGTWNNEGVIIFGSTTGLHRVSDAGGKPVAITTLDASQDETAHAEPSFLPDGRHYLFTAISRQGSGAITVGSLDSIDRVRLFAADSKAVFAEPGYLLFHREGTLLAQPFDADRLKLTEQPVRIADQVAYVAGNLQGAFAVSKNGVLVHNTGGGVTPTSRFQWFDRAGKLLGPAGDPGAYAPYFDLSPDGKLIAVTQRESPGSTGDIWLIDWMRGVRTRFTFDAPASSDGARDVIWSPDGLRLAFSTLKKGNRDVVMKNAGGLGDETPLLESPNREVVEDWSDDGRYLVYGLDSGPNPTPAQDLYALPLFGDRKPFPIIQSPFQENESQFSFDGKWLAYASNESGRFQVYVLSFPALDQKRQISTNGGSQPQWRKDGHELYYLATDGKLMAVDITADAKVDSGTPRELFDTELNLSPLQDQYRVTPDGQRFLLLKPVEATPTPITIVVNWFEELKRLEPAK